MNLDPFCSHNDSAIWCALRHVHLHTYVRALPEGLEHECGENGEALRYLEIIFMWGRRLFNEIRLLL